MTDIAITDLTNSTALSDGTGVFDTLITSVEKRIESQFQKGRLSGTDYASVYLGSMQAVLQQSVQYLLTEQTSGLQADQLLSQIAIERNIGEATIEKQWGYATTRDADGNLVLEATTGTGEQDYKNTIALKQIDDVIAGTARSYADVALLDQKQITELASTTDPTGGLLKAQFDNTVQQTALVADQELEVVDATSRANTALTQDILNKAEQVSASVASTTRADSESASKISLMADQELEVVSGTIRSDLESAAKISLMSDQELEVVSSTIRQDAETASKISTAEDKTDSQISLQNSQRTEVEAGTVRADAQSVAQIAKIAEDTTLISQKFLTELAQTNDNGLTGGLYGDNLGANPVTGQLGKQKELYSAQIVGFKGKHENEVTKMMLDSWSVIYSINDATLTGDLGTPDFLLQTNKGFIPTTGPVQSQFIDSQVTKSTELYTE